MALDPSNSGNLEQLVLKGFIATPNAQQILTDCAVIRQNIRMHRLNSFSTY